MTVSTSSIWKSAADAVRKPAGGRDKNLHIGKTLRDLYFDKDMPRTDGTFGTLLEQLDAAEGSRRKS